MNRKNNFCIISTIVHHFNTAPSESPEKHPPRTFDVLYNQDYKILLLFAQQKIKKSKNRN